MLILRKIIGGVIVLVGLVGLLGGLACMMAVEREAAELEQIVSGGMDFSLEALNIISDTLVVLNQTIEDTATVLDNTANSS